MTKIGGMWQTLTRKDMDPLLCVTYEMLKRCPGNTCEDKRRQCEGEDISILLLGTKVTYGCSADYLISLYYQNILMKIVSYLKAYAVSPTEQIHILHQTLQISSCSSIIVIPHFHMQRSV